MAELFDSMITFCYTDDMEATHRFYADTLRLPIVLEQGGCRVYRIAGAAYIGYCLRKDEKSGVETGNTANVTITLVTDEVDHWFNRVKASGYEIIKPPGPTPQYNIYNCFVKDPSGYTVEIQRFEDPRWPPKK